MKFPLLVFALLLGLPSMLVARDEAKATDVLDYTDFLKKEKAVAISESNTFLDGGSLSFVVVGQSGKRATFVLSVPSQRKDPRHFLSIYQSGHILLIPASGYDELAALLHSKLREGLAHGFQAKWPAFQADAEGLAKLLVDGGHRNDLDEFNARSVQREKRAHDPSAK